MRNLTSVCALIALFMLVAVIGCTQTSQNSQNPVNPDPLRSSDVVTITDTGTSCTTLIAGQFIDAGTVCLDDIDTDNDSISDALEVTYTTTGCWELVEAHLWIGTNLNDMPKTKQGNPIPGQFPYKSGDISGATTYTFIIPFTDLGFECGDTTTFYAAAHASLRCPNGDGSYQTQTGWGDGPPIGGNSWGTYFSFNIFCGNDEPPVDENCETAFAYGGSYAHCFITGLDFAPWNIPDNTFNRWGWTNGPLGAGEYTFDIYAGAGQCDLSKGTLVGTLTVDYDGSTAEITYTMDSGFTMDETHLYVGSEILPRDVNNNYTVAPGQYPDQHDLDDATTDSYTVYDLSGDIFVVAHAVVCWEE